MTLIASSFDILNPEGGRSAVNELLYAMGVGTGATLTLCSTSKEDKGMGAFLLEVTKIRLEYDNTGLFMLNGETSLGRVTGRLKPTNSAGIVGRVTISREGPTS